MSAGLNLDRIGKSFGDTQVLHDVCLDVRPGEFMSLVGPSGCGKSTLLRIIAGLEVQDVGRVAIGERDVDHLDPCDRNVAMVFQSYALYPHMSVFDNIALPLTMARLALIERLPLLKHLSPRRRRIRRDIARDVATVAAQLQIEPLLHRKPAQLSGGQKQRVALARAMVRHPTVFLMDEPLSNLDAQLRVHMRGELADLHARLGATFVYVTHDQTEAMTMSDRIALMDGGRILQVGTPAELYEKPTSLEVARFIGTPAINVLPVTYRDGDIDLFGLHLPLRLLASTTGTGSLAVRPESLRLQANGRPGQLRGIVHRNEHHGAERLVQIELQSPAHGDVTVRLPAADAHASIAQGKPIGITFDASTAHLFDVAGVRLDTEPERAFDEPMLEVVAGRTA